MCCHSRRHTIGRLGHVMSRWAEGLAPLPTWPRWRAVEGGTNRICDRKLCPRPAVSCRLHRGGLFEQPLPLALPPGRLGLTG